MSFNSSTNDMNLLSIVVIIVVLAVDDVSLLEVERLTATGMAIAAQSNTAIPNPARTNKQQLQFVADENALLFLFLERIISLNREGK